MNQPPVNNPYSPPQSPETDPPHRVKYFGLMWIGARTYFLLQLAAFVLMLVLLAVWWFLPVPVQVAASPLYKILPWVLVIGMIAEAVETVVMWRKFEAKRSQTPQ